MINATRRLLSTMAVICLVASTAMAEDPRTLEKQAAVPAEGLTITKAMAGKVDITKALAAKVKDNRLVIVATSAFLGVDAGNDKIVVDYVLDGTPQTIELSAIPGDELGVATPGADWVKGVAVLGASKPLPARGLGVKFAIYGKGDGWVDVTEPCNAAIANNKMTIVASDHGAGDPSSGARKVMLVSYVLDGKKGTISREEGHELTISTDTLTAQLRWDAIPPLKATFSRKIEARNTDLNRFIPVDGNTVFNAAGLLRTWPKDGPRELWRLKTGPSIGATVESGGRAFATGQLDGKQWAYCLEAKTGKISLLAACPGSAVCSPSPIIASGWFKVERSSTNPSSPTSARSRQRE